MKGDTSSRFHMVVQGLVAEVMPHIDLESLSSHEDFSAKQSSTTRPVAFEMSKRLSSPKTYPILLATFKVAAMMTYGKDSVPAATAATSPWSLSAQIHMRRCEHTCVIHDMDLASIPWLNRLFSMSPFHDISSRRRHCTTVPRLGRSKCNETG